MQVTFRINSALNFTKSTKYISKEEAAEIYKEVDLWIEGDCMRVVEICGSAGVGKSASWVHHCNDEMG